MSKSRDPKSNYVPVKLPDVTVRRLKFLAEFEQSDRSKTIRGLLDRAIAARLREIADAESGAPSPPLGPYRKKPRHDDTGPATPAIPEVA